MNRPARSRRSTAKATFRPSSRVYFRPRPWQVRGTASSSPRAGAAAIGMAAQGATVKIQVQSGGVASGLPAALAEYSFDEASGTVLDVSGNGHDWSLGAHASRTASGHTGNGMVTDGSGSTATLASPAFAQTSDRTVALWMKNPDVVTQWVVRWDVASINSGAWGILLLNTQVVVQARNASTFVRAAATRPSDGLWHHYAATYTSATNTLAFYLDGVLTDSQTLAGPLRTDADTIDIGEWTSTSTIVDDLRMYDSALDAATITAVAASPVGAVLGNPVHLAPVGMAAQNASVKIRVNPATAEIDLQARNAIPVQNIACAWFEATVTVDQHFCTVDLDSCEGSITLDAHEGVVGLDACYGEVVICGRE